MAKNQAGVAAVSEQEEKENKDILNAYRGLLRTLKTRDSEQTKLIRKAFNLAVEAHKGQRRRSGEPYILHPIAVARICSEEIGLGPTSVICALLHDTVEDTDITLEDIGELFGKTEKTIVDGLTKISGMRIQPESMQAENFRKVLLTLSEDVRVILIKIADRLHNMRTLGNMRRDKQLKIASETLFLYAPLAHRLGLYNIKSELEDLSFRYKSPTLYNDIQSKLDRSADDRKKFIKNFIQPIKQALKREDLKFQIKGRTKGIYSIYRKMQEKNVAFDEVYDLFAIRIIIDTPGDQEKADCWKAYSLVTDHYQPNPDRLRDWISIPKGNGYESLHTTVMSKNGRWVEVQIRSKRMDDQAEKGYAAHWKYKENGETKDVSQLEAWMNRIRDILEDPSSSALDFVYDFKLNLLNDEVYVFTPNGEMRSLPKGATALDFAFEIHSQLGQQCIGAKVNHKLVPLSHPLDSGDQIEIITSRKQTPKEDWLKYVVTGKARTKIKQMLRTQKRKLASIGKENVQRKFRKWGIKSSDKNIQILLKKFKSPSELDLYYNIARGKFNLDDLGEVEVRNGTILAKTEEPKKEDRSIEEIVQEIRGKKSSDSLLIGDDLQRIDYQIASCCNPIPGDDVFGFITVSEGIKIHRTNCPNAVSLMSNYAYRVVKARWKGEDLVEFLAGITFSGFDDVGLVNKITNIISHEHNVNMRSISFESNDGIFEGKIMVYVHDTEHLQGLIDKLKRVNGVRDVERMDQ